MLIWLQEVQEEIENVRTQINGVNIFENYRSGTRIGAYGSRSYVKAINYACI